MSQEAEPIAGDDLSALAWVQGELRRTLETAHKALRRYVREVEGVGGSDVDSADPAVLRNARVQLHQGVGALELVGLPVVAQVLRAGEAAVQRMVARPKLATPKAVETIEQASFAVLDYLGFTDELPGLDGRSLRPAIESERPQHACPPSRVTLAQGGQQGPENAQMGHAPVVDQGLVEE